MKYFCFIRCSSEIYVSKLWCSLFVLACGSPICFFRALRGPWGPRRTEIRINSQIVSDIEGASVFDGTLTVPRLHRIDGNGGKRHALTASPWGASVEMIRPGASQAGFWGPRLEELVGLWGDTAKGARFVSRNLSSTGGPQSHLELR